MKNKNLYLFFLIIIISVLLSSFSGDIYKMFIGPACTGFTPCPYHAENYLGFYFNFLFFGSLFSWIFTKDSKKKIWLWYVLPPLIFMLLLTAFKELIVGIGIVIISWLLAQGVLFIRSSFKKPIKPENS